MGRPKLTDEEKAARKAEKEKEKEEKVAEAKEIKEEIKVDTPKKLTKEELLERAKKLGEKVAEVKTEELKEQIATERKTLVPVEDYIKYGCYIGTKVITPTMRQYVYKRRNDGIAIFDVNKIDSKLKEFIKLVNHYKPGEFIIVCKREAGWNAVKKFSELTGVRVFLKKYPAGILTNSVLPNFFETNMVLVVDPWLDKNAMNDGKIIKKPVLALCDTNNYLLGVDHFVPCNNKAAKSIGLVFHVLAREYMKVHNIEKELPSIDAFVGDEQDQN